MYIVFVVDDEGWVGVVDLGIVVVDFYDVDVVVVEVCVCVFVLFGVGVDGDWFEVCDGFGYCGEGCLGWFVVVVLVVWVFWLDYLGLFVGFLFGGYVEVVGVWGVGWVVYCCF